jgi:hypothetical protein
MAQAAHAKYWADPMTLERHLDAVAAVYESVRADWRATSASPSSRRLEFETGLRAP